MPKPIKQRETSNPLGLKFHEVMKEKNMVGDYKALAAVFDVATPSVYDWIDHARISKDRYRQMVEWSGRSLDWWFDIPADAITKPAPSPPRRKVAVNEVNHPAWMPKDWPFKKITPRQWNGLEPGQRHKAEKLVLAYIEDNSDESAQTAQV